jgi:hypothetical protein
VEDNDVICSDCFHNEGLRLEAEKVGEKSAEVCPHCKSSSGRKIKQGESARLLMQNFFMHGSVPQDIGGWAPVYWWTDDIKRDDTAFDRTLLDDYFLIKSELGVCVFHYAPALWRLGLTTQYDELEKADPSATLKYIVQSGTEKLIAPGSRIYRVRLNPPAVSAKGMFDTPPLSAKKDFGRFDDVGTPIFYGAFDIETCLHECRVALVDEVILATFEAAKPLLVLNLFDAIAGPRPPDPWNSVEILMNKLCSSSANEYKKCRTIAQAVLNAGYEGILVRSYYSQVKDKPLANILLFGFPEAAQKIKLHSLNRIKLDKVEYAFTFGPVFIDEGA